MGSSSNSSNGSGHSTLAAALSDSIYQMSRQKDLLPKSYAVDNSVRSHLLRQEHEESVSNLDAEDSSIASTTAFPKMFSMAPIATNNKSPRERLSTNPKHSVSPNNNSSASSTNLSEMRRNLNILSLASSMTTKEREPKSKIFTMASFLNGYRATFTHHLNYFDLSSDPSESKNRTKEHLVATHD